MNNPNIIENRIIDGIQYIQVQPAGVCSQMIQIVLDGDTIKDVAYYGGCSGNTQGIASLVKGMNVNDVISKLQGIRCGYKATSCPDQLAQALKMIVNNAD